MKNYVANLIGEGVFDRDLPVDRPHPRPVRVGDEGVLLLYGEGEGGTVCVAARDEDDAERRLVATFGDGPYIDDLQESVDQRPLSVAYTQGRTDETAHELLLLDHRLRPVLEEERADIERIIRRMPTETQERYRSTCKWHRALSALDEALEGALARVPAAPDDDYGHYVVSTCHDGTDWCVRRATRAEIDDPEDETLPLADAIAFGLKTASDYPGSRFYDFSSDPADDEES